MIDERVPSSSGGASLSDLYSAERPGFEFLTDHKRFITIFQLLLYQIAPLFLSLIRE